VSPRLAFFRENLVERAYAELLRRRFTRASSRAVQVACRRVWRANGIDLKLI